ncbi:SDR family oxidoreductase [Roseateles sp. DAIF2]|uniref:oxidoreductase n=1 Tax=Roseateles sp. DAIF2 TaxID=2714952 RepID=UPI0018A26D5D|nr:oxidoreductase [Roseateles sp. DAIF2]QPF72727.1 SDR family oxidoreductase [Roseateles sp. DAIF2]
MTSSLLLQGKTILVVGAAGRIGRIIVDAVLSAGGRAVALDTDAAGLQALTDAHGKDALDCATVDMADRVSIDRSLADAHDRFGAVDGAVNTAYPRNARYGRHFFDVEYADFCENTGLHMGGYFLFMQACARYALERQQPFSLVNLSSIYGSMAPRFDVYAGTAMTMPVEYAAIKAGLEHMTRYANAYMKGRGAAFRANCVSPGGILAGQDEQFLARYGEHCLSKGMLDAQDVTGAIVFLLSDAARHIVGQNLIVDDGFST